MEIQDIQSKLWAAADKLRGNISSSDYKYVVLGLIFLKYISDAFEAQYRKAESENYDPEDRDYYLADNVFWVPKEARWEHLVANAKQPTIGVLIDEAMDAVERDNASLKGVLPKNYAREALDKRRLGELIDLFNSARFVGEGVSKARDLLGEVYEYFLGAFARAEGKRGGEFFTPPSVVKVIVEVLQPSGGRVYDPCCGSGGMFVQTDKFIRAHDGDPTNVHIYGQEANEETWRLAKMNLAIHGIDNNGLGARWGDTFARDIHSGVLMDYVMANPPFNIKDWARNVEDVRWRYGVPPAGNMLHQDAS